MSKSVTTPVSNATTELTFDDDQFFSSVAPDTSKNPISTPPNSPNMSKSVTTPVSNATTELTFDDDQFFSSVAPDTSKNFISTSNSPNAYKDTSGTNISQNLHGNINNSSDLKFDEDDEDGFAFVSATNTQDKSSTSQTNFDFDSEFNGFQQGTSNSVDDLKDFDEFDAFQATPAPTPPVTVVAQQPTINFSFFYSGDKDTLKQSVQSFLSLIGIPHLKPSQGLASDKCKAVVLKDIINTDSKLFTSLPDKQVFEGTRIEKNLYKALGIPFLNRHLCQELIVLKRRIDMIFHKKLLQRSLRDSTSPNHLG
eukprot:TRINITY_DN8637_c0_g1_i1.p1 TRINITY_DN8637_c0_g1~~TRINITY_DN8637_c0_g1_i1.p1  ORF type:complete len:335 (+),score=50.56 TRINITY_DN8637_c0_g1_i1:76-1005(+)